MRDAREKQLEAALAALVNLYVKNMNTPHEFITCITPALARDLSYYERRKDATWRAFDDARELLGGSYVTP